MIRFGIVGAGRIAEKFVQDCRFSKHAVVDAVASRTLEKAEKFAADFDIRHAFGSYEEMAQSDLIDAVYIATPHNFHMEQSIIFMKEDKHVLCEKPIAVNASQFNRMVAVAKQHHVLLMEAMWTRFLPATEKVIEIVSSNTLGKFKSANLEFAFDALSRNRGDDTGRLFNMNLAGGSLLDLGVYPVAYSLMLTSQPVVSINATATMYHTGVDAECTSLVEFADHAKVKICSSFLEDRYSPAVLEFEHGKVIVEHFSRSEKLIIDNVVREFPLTSGGFLYQIDAFSKTIEDGLLENDKMTHEQSRKCLEIMDRIRDIIGLRYPFE